MDCSEVEVMHSPRLGELEGLRLGLVGVVLSLARCAAHANVMRPAPNKRSER